MQWQQICDNPQLQNLPFKFETDRWGHIVMSPATNEHSLYQAAMLEWFLKVGQGGRPLPECSIQTSEGVKVTDVAWGSYAFFKKNRRANPYPEAPEIVVEIRSPSNSDEEMDFKRKLYFVCGALEFWTCSQGGEMRFFDHHGELSNSALLPTFPVRIEIDFA